MLRLADLVDADAVPVALPNRLSHALHDPVTELYCQPGRQPDRNGHADAKPGAVRWIDLDTGADTEPDGESVSFVHEEPGRQSLSELLPDDICNAVAEFLADHISERLQRADAISNQHSVHYPLAVTRRQRIAVEINHHILDRHANADLLSLELSRRDAIGDSKRNGIAGCNCQFHCDADAFHVANAYTELVTATHSESDGHNIAHPLTDPDSKPAPICRVNIDTGADAESDGDSFALLHEQPGIQSFSKHDANGTADRFRKHVANDDRERLRYPFNFSKCDTLFDCDIVAEI